MSRLQLELRMAANHYWVVIGLKNENLKEVYIPDKIDGYEVRSIADRAFANNLNITYVNMPETITYIGEDAFNGCSNLTRVYRYYNHYQKLVVKSRAFFCCENLSDIYLNNISELGKKAFAGCRSLTEFPFDECQDVKIFHQETFSYTQIQKVILHSQQVCKNVFYQTPVTEVFIKGNPTWSNDFHNVLRTAHVYVPKKSPFLNLGFYGIYIAEVYK